MKIDFVLWKISIFRFLDLHDESLLEIAFPAQDGRQGMVLVFTLKELESLTPSRASLLLDLKTLLMQLLVRQDLLFLRHAELTVDLGAAGRLITKLLIASLG